MSEKIILNKVIAMDKLRKNYKTYEMKRKLANSYELFFNDVNITPLLPPYLGKAFFTKKKFYFFN